MEMRRREAAILLLNATRRLRFSAKIEREGEVLT